MSRLESLEKMLEASPGDLFLHYGVAMEYLSASDREKASSKLEWIIEQDPSYLAVYYQLAKLYGEQGRKDEAVEVYEKGIAVASSQRDMKTLGELRSAMEELMFE